MSLADFPGFLACADDGRQQLLLPVMAFKESCPASGFVDPYRIRKCEDGHGAIAFDHADVQVETAAQSGHGGTRFLQGAPDTFGLHGIEQVDNAQQNVSLSAGKMAVQGGRGYPHGTGHVARGQGTDALLGDQVQGRFGNLLPAQSSVEAF